MIGALLVWFVLSASGGCRPREMCVDRPWSTSDADRVRIVDAPLGSAVAFLCSYCGETDRGEARFWYTSPRLRRPPDRPIAVGRKEVALGMADPAESNRVYMTADHSLVIQNLTRSDVGRYACSGLGPDGHVEFALDLLPRSGAAGPVSADSTSDWPRYVSRYLAPVAERFPQVRQVDVDWDAWGACDGCAGKRYRRAGCRVRFDDGTRMACGSIGLPANVSPGLASALSSVPDFLLAETCYAYCRLSNRHRLPKYRNTFVLEEGSSLTLVCAEATLDDKVIWRRDGRLLTESYTDDDEDDEDTATSLDAFGTLYLVGLKAAGSGNYTCYVNGNRTQEVLVAVRKSSALASAAYVRHLYYLCYAFALYLVIFSARICYAFLDRGRYADVAEDDALPPEIPVVYLGKKIRVR